MPDFSPIGEEVVEEFISSDSGEAVKRHRYGASGIVDFRPAAGTKTTTEGVRVFIAPITSRTQRPPEGSSRTGNVLMYSRADFRSVNDETGTRADEVERDDGSVWSVEAVDRYSAGKFYVSTLTLSKGPDA